MEYITQQETEQYKAALSSIKHSFEIVAACEKKRIKEELLLDKEQDVKQLNVSVRQAQTKIGYLDYLLFQANNIGE